MKEIIDIKKTQLSPKVLLDKENESFIISGKSGVENAEIFYGPILNWFINYFKNPNPFTEINLYLEYLNSASSVQIGKLLNMITDNLNKSKITINWIYDIDDELMKEMGKEFQYMYEIKFVFKENDEEKDINLSSI
jgi:hypothetical protein